jgi:hypothetical protein
MGIYCLLVGINDYAGDVPDLGGCHNDVERVANVLKTRFDIVDSNIQILLSQAATKANVVTGFLNHLKQARENDTVVFYYSGHGSQEKAPKEFWHIEPDHQNETLVCHDSRVGGGDLADKELRFLIAEVAKSGAEVVVLLDCCHSGNGTRATLDLDNADAVVSARLAKKATYSRRIENYCFYEDAKNEGWLYDMQHMPEGKHIIMSGCEDSELSKELNIQGKRHGAFTHYLCETLENAQYSLSYQNLLRKVKLQVRNLVTKQNPSLMSIKEAATDKLFLGNDIQPLRLSVFIKAKKWCLDAGAIHALHKGDEIAIYAESDANEQTILLTTTLKEVEAEKSILLISNQDAQKLDSHSNYYAEIIRQAIPKASIAFTGELAGTVHLFSAIETLDQAKNPSLYLQEVAPIDCEYRVVADNNHYVIMSADEDHPLFKIVQGYSAESAKTVLQQAEHLARWNNKLTLVNPRSRIPTDIVQMFVSIEGEEHSGDQVDLSYQQHNGEWQAPEFTIELRYDEEAEYSKPLFCSVLMFNPFDASVDIAMDNGIWLRPATVFENDAGSVNKVHKVLNYELFDGESVEVVVEDERFERGITQTQDIFKLIVSETPFNANLLTQDGLDTYKPEEGSTGRGIDLDSILDENFAETTRKIKRKSKKIADWATSSLIINTLRPMQATAVSASRTVSLGLGIDVAPHELNALLSLESSQQSSRTVDGTSANHKLTPDCFNRGDNHSAFGFSTGRSVDLGLDTLVIQSNDIAGLSNKLSAANPLVISVDKPLADNEQILPYVSDGEFFYPVGFSEKTADKIHILIQDLPPLDTETPIDNTSSQIQAQGKGLMKSFKVFFQKVAYDKLRLEYSGNTCLSIAEFSDKHIFKQSLEVTENHIAVIQAAKRIVVLVHGIAGEAQSMLSCLSLVDEYAEETDQPLKASYDLVLMFDYESLNTPIETTAQMLKDKLESCGLGAEHTAQLDIIAFDMGGLVTRWMIEKEQCDDGRINQVVLLGVPNQGCPWASLQDKGHDMAKNWAYGSLTLILNNLTAIPVGGHIVSALMKLIEAADNTLEQLHPESELIAALAKSESLNTAYISIIGSTENLMVDMSSSSKNQWAKMMFFVMHRFKLAAFDLLTEKLFKQSNDFAFSDESMRALPEGLIEKMRFANVDCDHFSYCNSLDSVQQIKQALT